MLYNEKNLAVAAFASKSETRQELAGVFFTADKTIATDSFRLVEVSTVKDVDVESFPKVQGASAMRGCQPFIADAKALKGVKIPKAKRGTVASLPILQYAAIKHLDAQGVAFMVTDLETADIKSVRRIDAKYPEYEQVFPAGEPIAEVSVNGQMLAEVLAFLATFDGIKSVKMQFHGAGNAIVLTAGNAQQKARAMVMPMRG